MRNLVVHRRVSSAEIKYQREQGWPDFHPEDYCHRCGYANTSWYVDSSVWNQVMREDNAKTFGDWNEIICIPCFVELAAQRYGAGSLWTLQRDEHGTEKLILVYA